MKKYILIIPAILFVAYIVGSFIQKENGVFQRAGVFLGIESLSHNSSFIIHYSNDKYGFSLEIPKDMKTSEFQEGPGDMIMIRNSSFLIQAFIMPWDEPGIITPERIKQDLPTIIVEEPQQAIIGQDKIQALIFFSQEESLGRTREVWFVKNGFLYQITALAEKDKAVGEILESLKFE